jgi:proteic killer suppression protein
MDVEFADEDLDRLETDSDFNAGFSRAIVRAFRKRIQLIRAATDEREFYAMKSLHYEKLKGGRSHQRSMRLNKQWRLVLEVSRTGARRVIVVIEIEDYHKKRRG